MFEDDNAKKIGIVKICDVSIRLVITIKVMMKEYVVSTTRIMPIR